jgi:hypothetical protein
MSRTNHTGPLSFGENTGRPTTDTLAWVPGRRQVNLSQGTPSATLTIPAKSTVTKLAFVPTSAFTGTDPVSAMNITFANGTLVHGIVTASAATRYHESTFVSAADYDAGGTMTITLSALSTTVFTGGGGRAFVEYITVE